MMNGDGGKPAADPGAVAAGAATAIGGIGEALGAVVVVFFLGVYGALQPGAYTAIALKLVPVARRKRVSLVLTEIGDELTKWLMGRLVAMLFVGVFVTIGLVVMRVPLAVPLGVLAGLLTFVEYVGAVASAAPPALLAIARGPGIVLGVLGRFTVSHVIEGYLLTPLLARTTVRFPPGYTLAGQVVLGSIFGVAGLTFATPVLVIATILVNRLYVEDALGDRSALTVGAPGS
jgi:predicted PurR-regulated permease PerM